MKKKIFIIVGDNLDLSRDQIDYEDLEIIKFQVLVEEKEYRESDQYNANWLISKFEKENVVAKSSTLPQMILLKLLKEIIEITTSSFMW